MSRLRHSLNDESVRSGTVLGSWSNVPDLVPEADMVQLLTDKRGKAVGTQAAKQGGQGGQGSSDVIVID